jgi:SAM-dependent methyltransferase
MSTPASIQQLDWGIGEYEHTAAELEPVARYVVELAAITPGERVLDIACGTGNAALLAAAAGAAASGLDASRRLVEVARGRAAAEGLDVSFVVGDLHELPFSDGSSDVALSIFGLIFAAQPDRAAAELVRVLAPGGRGLVTTWIPEGAIDAMVGVAVRAVQAATGTRVERFPWSDRDAVSNLFARHGASVEFNEASVSFVGDSPEAYLTGPQAEHPMHVASRPLLESAGTYDTVREQMLAALEEGNEDPAAFRVTSRYLVARITRA